MRFVVAAFLSALAALPVSAQNATQPCTPGMTSPQFLGAVNTAKAPFTGTIQTTSEHKLNDGTVLQGSYTVQAARDSAGRTYGEQAMNCERDQDGNAHLIKMVNVNDFATRTFMHWAVGRDIGGVANVQHLSATPRAQTEPRPQPLFKPWQSHQAQFQTEHLGSRTIAGVLAEGTRTTMTYAAGEAGNSQPFSVVDENWHSKDLKMDLAVTHDDPRSGKTTSEFITLDLTEPDPTLFQPPPNYTVRDTTPNATP